MNVCYLFPLYFFVAVLFLDAGGRMLGCKEICGAVLFILNIFRNTEGSGMHWTL